LIDEDIILSNDESDSLNLTKVSIHWFRHEAESRAQHVISQDNSLNPE
jgi:hypothetical protein